MWNRRPAQDEMKSRELSIFVTHVRIDTSSCQPDTKSISIHDVFLLILQNNKNSRTGNVSMYEK